MFVDRREHSRVPGPSGTVRFRPARSGRVTYMEGGLENLSLGGIFIVTDHVIPIGQAVEMELRLETDPYPIQASGIVRWERTVFEPVGIGVQFLDFAGSGRERLSRWLDRMRVPALGR